MQLLAFRQSRPEAGHAWKTDEQEDRVIMSVILINVSNYG